MDDLFLNDKEIERKKENTKKDIIRLKCNLKDHKKVKRKKRNK